MQRTSIRPRPNRKERVEDEGLVFNASTQPDGSILPYWREGVVYRFTPEEIAYLERASAVIFEMFDKAGSHIVSQGSKLLARMGIPTIAHQAIIDSWNDPEDFTSVYGRFDLRFGGFDHPDKAMRQVKLYEFNADTPTSLLEAGHLQWLHFEDTGKDGEDQWNSIHERLVEAWKRNLAIIERRLGFKPSVAFFYTSADTSGEDLVNTTYMADTCAQAGYDVRVASIESICLAADGRFYLKPEGREQDTEFDPGELVHLDVAFKLFPWEWMCESEWAEAIFADIAKQGEHNDDGHYTGGTYWIEDVYKMLWSTKAILPILWELFKDNPDKSQYLLECYFEGEEPSGFDTFARKPIYGREGADIQLVKKYDILQETGGDYGKEGFVLQSLAEPPVFIGDKGQRLWTVIGVWMVDGEPAGCTIREAVSPITNDGAFFVPNVIDADNTPDTTSDTPTYVGFTNSKEN